MFSLFTALIAQFRHAFAGRSDLILENLALRQQLAVHQRKGRRLKLNATDRLFWVWLSSLWRNWRCALLIVQPKTVIGGIVSLETLLDLEEPASRDWPSADPCGIERPALHNGQGEPAFGAPNAFAASS